MSQIDSALWRASARQSAWALCGRAGAGPLPRPPGRSVALGMPPVVTGVLAGRNRNRKRSLHRREADSFRARQSGLLQPHNVQKAWNGLDEATKAAFQAVDEDDSGTIDAEEPCCCSGSGGTTPLISTSRSSSTSSMSSDMELDLNEFAYIWVVRVGRERTCADAFALLLPPPPGPEG